VDETIFTQKTDAVAPPVNIRDCVFPNLCELAALGKIRDRTKNVCMCQLQVKKISLGQLSVSFAPLTYLTVSELHGHSHGSCDDESVESRLSGTAPPQLLSG
jgi:hypothetical protein